MPYNITWEFAGNIPTPAAIEIAKRPGPQPAATIRPAVDLGMAGEDASCGNRSSQGASRGASRTGRRRRRCPSMPRTAPRSLTQDIS